MATKKVQKVGKNILLRNLSRYVMSIWTILAI